MANNQALQRLRLTMLLLLAGHVKAAEDCITNPCKNGGTFVDGGVNTYTCSCAYGYDGFHCQNELPTHNCFDLLKKGHRDSGVYKIYLEQAMKYVQVNCDMETDGGGWLVFQRRQDGSINFYRNWADYKKGFGKLSGEFWLGNDYLHDLTSQAKFTLRIDMEDFKNVKKYAVYSDFAVASESKKYRLSFDTYSGNAEDSLRNHNGMAFTTMDRDNDVYTPSNCATFYMGGWWYKECARANLNGRYLGAANTKLFKPIIWREWHGLYYSLKKVEMKMRP
ncbi:Fibrinogen C domain-containing protein 1-B [Lamellibrachia satsuma]|nr:Fibrinogen C domain-containing protein 1-B [Lamellibrachia satsuma]